MCQGTQLYGDISVQLIERQRKRSQMREDPQLKLDISVKHISGKIQWVELPSEGEMMPCRTMAVRSRAITLSIWWWWRHVTPLQLQNGVFELQSAMDWWGSLVMDDLNSSSNWRSSWNEWAEEERKKDKNSRESGKDKQSVVMVETEIEM